MPFTKTYVCQTGSITSPLHIAPTHDHRKSLWWGSTLRNCSWGLRTNGGLVTKIPAHGCQPTFHGSSCHIRWRRNTGYKSVLVYRVSSSYVRWGDNPHRRLIWPSPTQARRLLNTQARRLRARHVKFQRRVCVARKNVVYPLAGNVNSIATSGGRFVVSPCVLNERPGGDITGNEPKNMLRGGV